MVDESLSLKKISERLKNLYTPAISDTLDEMGYTSFSMKHTIKPLIANLKVAGQAITMKAKVYEKYKEIEMDKWLQVLLDSLEAAEPGKIFVVETGENLDIASWGELMSNTAMHKGVEGAITDGAVRDTQKILEISPSFQIFAASRTPKDSKGRLEFIEFNTEILCAGVRVRPNDFVFGDEDGVVVIPKEIVNEVVTEAENRANKEESLRKSIIEGMDVKEAYKKYRVF